MSKIEDQFAVQLHLVKITGWVREYYFHSTRKWHRAKMRFEENANALHSSMADIDTKEMKEYFKFHPYGGVTEGSAI